MFVECFEQEVCVILVFNYFNIVMVYEICNEGGCCFLVIEFIEGQMFCEFMEEEWFDIDCVFEVVCQIVDVLGVVYEKGIFYCDIKFDNIMVCDDGLVKVFDFGLVKFVCGDSVLDNEIFVYMIEFGMVLGIISYMLFEQVCGEKFDYCSDFFFLGVVLYELFLGIQLFW